MRKLLSTSEIVYIFYISFADDYNSTQPCFVRLSPENCPKSGLFLILAILIGEKWHFLVESHRWAGKKHSEVCLHKISRMFEHLKFRISAKNWLKLTFLAFWGYLSILSDLNKKTPSVWAIEISNFGTNLMVFDFWAHFWSIFWGNICGPYSNVHSE